MHLIIAFVCLFVCLFVFSFLLIFVWNSYKIRVSILLGFDYFALPGTLKQHI